MTPEQTEEIAALKAALKQHIEEAEKGTPGPWDAFQRDSEIGSNYCRITFTDRTSDSLHGYCGEANATFIARARTMSPLACRIALAGIEALEKIRKTDCPCETYCLAEKDLLSILAIWKGGEA